MSSSILACFDRLDLPQDARTAILEYLPNHFEPATGFVFGIRSGKVGAGSQRLIVINNVGYLSDSDTDRSVYGCLDFFLPRFSGDSDWLVDGVVGEVIYRGESDLRPDDTSLVVAAAGTTPAWIVQFCWKLHDACYEARHWLIGTRPLDLADAWDTCPQGEWMAWLLHRCTVDAQHYSPKFVDVIDQLLDEPLVNGETARVRLTARLDLSQPYSMLTPLKGDSFNLNSLMAWNTLDPEVRWLYLNFLDLAETKGASSLHSAIWSYVFHLPFSEEELEHVNLHQRAADMLRQTFPVCPIAQEQVE